MGHVGLHANVPEVAHPWTAHCDLVDAVGTCTEDTKAAISSALSYLGITSVQSSDATLPIFKFVISLCDDVTTTSSDQIQFNQTARSWHHSSAVAKVSEGFTASSPLPIGQTNLPSKTSVDNKAVIQTVEKPSEDWTTLLPKTSHVEFLKSREWHKTSLGPLTEWPYVLKLMTMKMINDPRPANLYWGPTRIAIYNEPFSIIAASRHPMMMGSTAEEALPATYPFLSGIFDMIEESGVAFSMPEFEMSVEKTAGFIEEAWYDGIFSPIYDTDATFLGLYNSGYEMTDRILAQRNARMIHQIGNGPEPATSPWEHLIRVFAAFERDIPFLVLYSTDDYADTHSTGSRLLYQGSLGIDKGHPALPEHLDIHQNNDGFRPILRTAKAKGVSVRLEMPGGKVPDFLATDVHWRGHGDACSHIVVTPLNTSRTTIGFLIMGLNPRRQYDEIHKGFGEDVGRVANGLLTHILSLDQAQEREEKLMKELTQRQKLLQRVAEFATVGMYTHSVNGHLDWANPTYFDICGVATKTDEKYEIPDIGYAREEDREKSAAGFRTCLETMSTHTMELPLNKTWRPPGCAHDEPRWVMTSIAPNVENGKVADVLGCVVDISHLKWAEKLQTKMADAAKHAKDQQERFIDITSHEMRNPLSAIMQSADDITSTCQKYQNTYDIQIPSHLAETFEIILDSSRTVSFCAAHQNQIVDDILTVSKLENSMLTITPMPVDPVSIAGQVLRTFAAEMTATGIQSSLDVQASYTDLGITSVLLDPTRLTQILINLITNAVKFTRLSKRRVISLRVSASTTRPFESLDQDLQWFPGTEHIPQVAEPQAMKHTIYVMFEVEDSGIGISSEEASTLFRRFAQATPRTHVTYGGSGLGLFISRKLVELQGGMIGVLSKPGDGSTFTFYVETQKARSLENDKVQKQPELHEDHSSLVVGIGQQHKLPGSASGNGQPLLAMSSTPKINPKESLSILFVEDNLINQKVLSKQLERLGCKVQVANHGKEALNVIKKSAIWSSNDNKGLDIDIVLMDWEMPVMDGLTCTKQIRAMEATGSITKHTPIIGTTANARAEQVETAMSAGMDDLITKPFTVTQLMKRIERLIPV